MGRIRLAGFDLEHQTDPDLLLKIQRAREGKLGFTLVLNDPFGNSTIISEKAQNRRLGERGPKGVKFGEQTITVRNVQ